MRLENKNYNAGDIIKIPFKFAPAQATLIAIQKLLDGLVPTLQILATAKFLDIAILIFKQEKNIKDIVMPLLFVILLLAYDWISTQLSKFAEVQIKNRLRGEFRVNIVEKIATLRYKYIESQDSWDLISRVIKEPEVQCTKAYISSLDMIAMILKITGILVVLFIQVWWSAVLIVLISVPLFFIALKSGKETYEANREVEKNKRKVKYLEEVLNGREAVEERTLFGYSDKINNQWHKEFETARKHELKVSLKWYVNMKTGGVIIAILSVLIVLILIGPVTSGILSIGMFMSIVNSVFELIQYLAWSLPEYGDNLAKNKEYLVDLTNFLKLEGDEGYLLRPAKEVSKLKSLEFRNVSFKYPGTEKYILKDISFVIEEGRHYAFVGANGAGKTTITKLITGLYEDFEGEILINGKSIKTYRQDQLKAMCSVVYQDFARYSISFRDNILLGDINSFDNLDNMNKAIETVELQDVVGGLPLGISSNLGKIKNDGVDLSGGQWQRIAMARGIVSPASIRILDEPTAALDPISESNVYEKFEEISRGQTTIFISHRLGSTKIADEIFVIGDGAIVESGSYEELMKKNGVYTKMYESQRSWYI
ncbi:ABC transporter ATP-binding protein [Clostridium sulfidigenes]|uniref:ABC transporter ATP-binding protein n=1 Tax=Clostridium sulfidigenes TaxID=318464 RepID=A0A084JAQ3_9CLOT|nr:ABC transporter ATP-binding protein [Clostridium sulfidigenes]KEZ86037.1 ABC transporter ATP-binding protein [Clostridium sulfidigenes]